MTDRQEMEAVLEAILFVAQGPVTRDKLMEVFDERERLEASAALDAVLERYGDGAGRGMMVDEVAGGLRLVSRPDLHGYLRRFFEVTGSNKLTMAALETLAIIAYHQPVTGPEISELRGVSSSGVLKKLLERRLIRVAGRKEVVGKPFLYATTRDFLMHFGLKSIKELPPLDQFEELFGGEAEGELPEPVGSDPEERADREAAELEASEGDAAEAAERDEVEAERQDAEDAEAAEEDEEVEAGETPALPVEAEAGDDVGQAPPAEGAGETPALPVEGAGETPALPVEEDADEGAREASEPVEVEA